MGAGVIRSDASATFGIDPKRDSIPNRKHALLDLYFVKRVPGSHRVSVFYLSEYGFSFDRSGVSDLTASFGIEGGSIENNLTEVATRKLRFRYFPNDDRQYLSAVGFSFAITGELGRLQVSDHAGVDLAHSTTGVDHRRRGLLLKISKRLIELLIETILV